LASSFNAADRSALRGSGADGQKPAFLTGMLPTIGREAKFTAHRRGTRRANGRKAAYLATPTPLCRGGQHLGSLDKVTQIVRLACWWPRWGYREQPKIADSASELLQDVFGKKRTLPPGVWRAKPSARTPVELEIISEVASR